MKNKGTITPNEIAPSQIIHHKVRLPKLLAMTDTNYPFLTFPEPILFCFTFGLPL